MPRPSPAARALVIDLRDRETGELPGAPAPLPGAIASVFLEDHRAAVMTRRIVSIPIDPPGFADPGVLTERMIPQLLRSCRSAA